MIFNEQKCGFEESTQQEPQKYVCLEYSEEPLEMVDSSESLPPEPPLSRRNSEHHRKQTEFYGQRCNITDIKEPKSISEAQENQHWANAMKNEIDFLHDNNVWELVELGSQWGADGFLK